MSANGALFYLQDSRSYIGNDVVWWAKNGNGYTTDISKAHLYTKEEAQRMHYNRATDIPWPKEYIEARTRPAVDAQYIKRKEALAGTGIELLPTRKPKRETPKCVSCGRFLRLQHLWSGACPNCGADNRP